MRRSLSKLSRQQAVLTRLLRTSPASACSRNVSCTPLSTRNNRGSFYRYASTEKVVEAEVIEDDNATTKDPLANEEVDIDETDGVDEDVSKAAVNNETVSGDQESHTFQAETKKILDIVANSLYTDKEVFLRELISNASDALEKARYRQVKGQDLTDEEVPFEIKISANEADNTLIIQDTGIGMSKDELVLNLGTIARSGTKAFVEASKLDATGGDASNMIGQFGVGFYSVFMVSDKVEVYSKSADPENNQAYYWSSDGTGSYTIQQADNVVRGTKVVIHLKQNSNNFAIKHVVEGIIRKYSNFVGFDISVNASKLNTVHAIWKTDKSAVNDEMHLEFYRYIANAYDTPFFRLHFTTDAPIDINALFYFPERHMEKYGMGRADPGVSLYCRKVLIQPKCAAILPEWLRFVKGVVDSEDIPLNISRESMQDSALIARMNTVLTKRIIKHLAEMAKKDRETYLKFYVEFNSFLKEGVCMDFNNKAQIGGLLYFDTSFCEADENGNESLKNSASLDDYISRMPTFQDKIYYLNAPNRKFALESPYFEAFDKAGTEVLFLTSHIDDFVMKNLSTYQKRALVSIEGADVRPPSNLSPEEKKVQEEKDAKEQEANKEGSEALLTYFKDSLSEKVSQVKVSTRSISAPAIIVDHESAAVHKMQQYMEATQGGASRSVTKQKLEINTSHPVLQGLMNVKESDPELAKAIVEQVYDNALIAADILDNPRAMLARMNKILTQAVKST